MRKLLERALFYAADVSHWNWVVEVAALIGFRRRSVVGTPNRRGLHENKDLNLLLVRKTNNGLHFRA